ncbi:MULTISPECIES: hypothetical protein [unclassified Acinetobacter]|uniref:hypothetical protein n=1 Tax=unclassified Acinetobacter TaxID=196816 RepID=UPI0015D3C284|nr:MULTISPECIES: hypothetical protein [unclassified Acinetobacter]
MESNSLAQYLYEIAQRSANAQIDWIQPNPSTYQWNSEENGLTVTIQRATSNKAFNSLLGLDSTPVNVSYLFQVLENRTKQIVVSISSKERPEFFDVLNEIYLNVKHGMDKRSSDVLAKLLRFK